MKKLTMVEMGRETKDYVRANFDTYKEAAEYYDVLPASMSNYVNGNTTPCDALLEDAGYEKKEEVYFVRKKK